RVADPVASTETPGTSHGTGRGLVGLGLLLARERRLHVGDARAQRLVHPERLHHLAGLAHLGTAPDAMLADAAAHLHGELLPVHAGVAPGEAREHFLLDAPALAGF